MKVQQQVLAGSTALHTVTDTEKRVFAENLSNLLKGDKDVAERLPLTAQNLFDSLTDGVILCKLINQAAPESILDVAINIKPPLSIYKVNENLNLAISTAKSIGIVVINVHPDLIREKKEHIVLGLVWQLVKMYMFRKISLRYVPEMILLKKEGEEDQVLYKLRPEEILIRWFNYHMRINGEKREIKNMGPDLSDAVAYGHVFSHISKQFKEDYWTLSAEEKAGRCIKHAEQQNIKAYVRATDITSGNERLNILFAAQVFNHNHGLQLKEKAPVVIQESPDTNQSRQVKVFKNWINAMGLDGVFLTWLIEELKDGRVLLKIVERFRPGMVDWNTKVTNKNLIYAWIGNNNYFLQLLKDNFKEIQVVNVNGKDISEGNTKLVLGVIWQLCRQYWIERTGVVNEVELVEWANSRVPEEVRIKNLRDKSIANCKFLLSVIDSINSHIVDWSLLKQGGNKDDQMNNIKYTISCARKIGAEVMLLWEHIQEVDSKFIQTFLAELQYQAKLAKK